MEVSECIVTNAASSWPTMLPSAPNAALPWVSRSRPPHNRSPSRNRLRRPLRQGRSRPSGSRCRPSHSNNRHTRRPRAMVRHSPPPMRLHRRLWCRRPPRRPSRRNGPATRPPRRRRRRLHPSRSSHRRLPRRLLLFGGPNRRHSRSKRSLNRYRRNPSRCRPLWPRPRPHPCLLRRQSPPRQSVWTPPCNPA